MSDFSSPKKGSNIICRVSNATPEMVCKYVSRLPKQKMREEDFREYMGKSWFQNEHQAPEQWGLYYIDGTYYYPRFDRDITIEEAERYLYGWIKRLIVINPYTRFQSVNDNRLVESIVKQLEINPDEHDLKTIFRNIIQSDEPFIVNEIIANALNTYSEVLSVKVIDKDNEKFYVSLLPNYKEILKTKYNMTKKEYFDSFSDINTSAPLNEPNQVIYFGAPGTGKSHTVKGYTKELPEDNVFRTTFHPDSDYATFVGCYKPTKVRKAVRDMAGNIALDKNKNEIYEESITYEFVPQAFTKAYIRAWQTEEPVFLVIEEINRGNCAQIFGDLFQLLDRENNISEYPVKPDTDLGTFIHTEFKKGGCRAKEESTVFKGEELILPANLYIWATMNTSDQSLFPIDSAFKRRWDWRYVPIENAGLGYKIKVNGHEYDWWRFLEAINDEVLELTNSEDKQLGYFFVRTSDGIIDAKMLVNKVYFYLWNDVFKDYEIDSLKAFRQENGKAIAFKDFFKGGFNEELAEQVLKNLKLDEPAEQAE